MARRHAATPTGIGRTATSIFKDTDGYTCVRYHATIVVMFNDAEIILNTGGWRTNTTKARINQASDHFGLGVGVFQRDGEFWVGYAGKYIPMLGDRMTLDRPTGAVTDNRAA